MTLNVIDDDNVEKKKKRQHLFDIIYNVYCTKYFIIYTCLVSSLYIIDDETLSHSFLLIHGGDDHRNILLIALRH